MIELRSITVRHFPSQWLFCSKNSHFLPLEKHKKARMRFKAPSRPVDAFRAFLV